ncbi:hypothetical protein RUM44_001333 [Polyplax serrata]|uniref:Uncharacterized protein n=1 Tax=Polyplax serrata TaxID=468196 RepID=A0ABR1AJT2_POLSC
MRYFLHPPEVRQKTEPVFLAFSERLLTLHEKRVRLLKKTRSAKPATEPLHKRRRIVELLGRQTGDGFVGTSLIATGGPQRCITSQIPKKTVPSICDRNTNFDIESKLFYQKPEAIKSQRGVFIGSSESP